MRFVSYRTDGDVRPGLLLPDSILDLGLAFRGAINGGLWQPSLFAADQAIPSDLTGFIALGERFLECAASIREAAQDAMFEPARVSIAAAELVAPLHRPKKNVFCVGSNYRAHVTESSRAQKVADNVPKYPVFFSKPPTAVIGPNAEIRLDPTVSDKVDYEVELGIVFGKPGRNIPADRADEHIFGLTIINDVTARDIQRRHGGQFLKGKGQDTFCPMGPCIVTLDELSAYDNLAIRLSVNGELRQDGNTANMIFSVPTLVESLSEGMTLEPGDVLATGTPSGVGYAMDPPRFLRHGDRTTCEIEGIGELTNVVADVTVTDEGGR